MGSLVPGWDSEHPGLPPPAYRDFHEGDCLHTGKTSPGRVLLHTASLPASSLMRHSTGSIFDIEKHERGSAASLKRGGSPTPSVQRQVTAPVMMTRVMRCNSTQVDGHHAAAAHHLPRIPSGVVADDTDAGAPEQHDVVKSRPIRWWHRLSSGHLNDSRPDQDEAAPTFHHRRVGKDPVPLGTCAYRVPPRMADVLLANVPAKVGPLHIEVVVEDDPEAVQDGAVVPALATEAVKGAQEASPPTQVAAPAQPAEDAPMPVVAK